MTQPDPENNPPSFVERLDLILCKLFAALSTVPLLALMYAGFSGQWLFPPTVENLRNYRSGLILIWFGCFVLYSIFWGIVFLTTGKRTDSFTSSEKNSALVGGVCLFMINIGWISWLIHTK